MIPSEFSTMQKVGNYPDYPTGAKGANVPVEQDMHPDEQDLHPKKEQDLHLEKWYDNYEVMEMFHISQRTLQTLRSNGKLPFAKLGNKCFYREQDLQYMMMESFRDSRVKFSEKGGAPWQ